MENGGFLTTRTEPREYTSREQQSGNEIASRQAADLRQSQIRTSLNGAAEQCDQSSAPALIEVIEPW
jgi:hypothetical protein